MVLHLSGAFLANAFNDEVHFGGRKTGWQRYAGDFMIGQAKSFLTGIAVEVNMHIMMFML